MSNLIENKITIRGKHKDIQELFDTFDVEKRIEEYRAKCAPVFCGYSDIKNGWATIWIDTDHVPLQETSFAGILYREYPRLEFFESYEGFF